jgi:hypothetical protein
MYAKHVVVSESWRDFIAEAPNYKLEIFAGVPYFFDLQDILLQGAVGLNGISPILDYSGPSGLSIYSVEDQPFRGWRFKPSLVSQPSNATVEPSRDHKGWIITADSSYSGNGCFNYVLSNDFQVSYFGKIELDIFTWYDIEAIVNFDPSEGKYRIELSISVPPNADTPVFSKLSWSYFGPNDDNRDNNLDVGSHNIFYSTRYSINSQNYIYVLNTGLDTGWFIPETDVVALGSIDPDTSIPYKPLDSIQDIEITVDLFLDGSSAIPDLTGRVFTLKKKLSEILHIKPWYESGIIKNSSIPNSSEAAGTILPPYITEIEKPEVSQFSFIPSVRQQA